ncbi:hypothetical protein LQF76_11235 [Gloeomargaritales cyanobacterium VI4D9]|nr:hypothetical protein LQF76_11235 [Gloeomargaritales cyanobacterium VI4D9]
MKHKLSIAVITVITTVMTMILFGYYSHSLFAQETRTPESTYIGLWEGVDQVDGGNSLRSIFPTKSGFRVVGRDTWHGSCGYGDPAVVLAQLDVDQGSLKGTWKLDCQARETAETGDRSFKVRYTYEPRTQTLEETLLDPKTEQPINRIPIVFFRINPR